MLPESVTRRTWHHTIELAPGEFTPGLWSREAQSHIYRLMDRVDYQSKDVLDVGTLDGLWAFEAEKRGAGSVYTFDLEPRPTFDVAAQMLCSDVSFSVADVESDTTRCWVPFDIVQFFGVYYHLRNPLRAFANLRCVTDPKGVLLVEGETCEGSDCSAKFLHSTVHCNDPSNWWVPTLPCLLEWVESSGFGVEWHSDYPVGQPFARSCVVARPVAA